jgi:guanylate kinase
MNAILRRGLCLVIAAPSGGGKGAITQALLAGEDELSLSVSVTTRPPRGDERDGVHYHFIDQPHFDAMVEAGALLEYARVFGRNCYGTPRAPVQEALAAGRDVIFDIDWQGYRQLRDALPGDVVGVFLLPPSMAELERRLRGRGTDTPAEIAERMATAHNEISHWTEFDHVVLNDDFAATLAAIRAILLAARLRTDRQTGIADFVARLGA